MQRRQVLHLYVACVVVAALAVVAAVAIGDPRSDRWWLGALVAAGLAASHLFETRVPHTPRQRESYSHEETYVVVLGLLTAPLVTACAFAAAFAAGSVIARREPLKAVFNTAAMTLQAAAAAVVIDALRGDEGLGLRTGVAAVAGAVVFFALNRLLMATVLALAGARTLRDNLVDDARSRITVATADTSIGVLAAYAAIAEPWTLPLAAVAVGVLHSALSGHAAARSERRRYADVVASTSDGIVAVGRDGRVSAWNPACERLTGYRAAEVMGLTLDEVTTLLRAQRKQGRDRALSPLDAEAGELYDVQIRRRDGHDRWLAVSRAPTPERGAVIVLRDETPRREAEELRALEESERLRSDLVAAVSHELRTPLTSMVGFTRTLLDRKLGDEERRRYLEIVHDQGMRLGELIDDLLDLRSVEATPPARDPVDVAALLREQVEELRVAAPGHAITLDVRTERAYVRGDRRRLGQVVENLVSNAVKYSPGGGAVDVRLTIEAQWVRVTVRDEGLGIPRDQQAHVFTRFFRVNAEDRQGIPGTGLGLALARDIVRAHGGAIGFDSDERGGSTFWFELPLLRDGDAGASAAPTAEPLEH